MYFNQGSVFKSTGGKFDYDVLATDKYTHDYSKNVDCYLKMKRSLSFVILYTWWITCLWKIVENDLKHNQQKIDNSVLDKFSIYFYFLVPMSKLHLL